METNGTGRGAQYRRKAIERAAAQEVTLPSGAVFLLRRPSLEVWTMSGELPLTITVAMQRAQRLGQNEQEAFAALSQEDQLKAVEFSRKLVCWCCVDPKVVQSDDPADDEICLHDLEKEDLAFLAQWANSGGGVSAEAEKFRGGPGQAAVAGAGRKKRG